MREFEGRVVSSVGSALPEPRVSEMQAMLRNMLRSPNEEAEEDAVAAMVRRELLAGASYAAGETAHCAWCSRTDPAVNKRCSRCKGFRYCGDNSGACQRAHWKARHRATCTPPLPELVQAEQQPGGLRGVRITASSANVLVVGDLGIFHLEDDFMVTNLRKALDGHAPYEVVGANEGRSEPESHTKVLAKLTSGKFTTCILLGVGQNGDASTEWLLTPQFKVALAGFVKVSGGSLLVNGERMGLHLLRECFECPLWAHGNYCRDGHTLASDVHAVAPGGQPLHAEALPLHVGGKAVHVSGAAPNERLYIHNNGYGAMTQIAYANCGNGRVAFFGDVNSEEYTNNTVRVLASRLPHSVWLWQRRRSFVLAVAAALALPADISAEGPELTPFTSIASNDALVRRIASFL